jgi:hypothetical protein
MEKHKHVSKDGYMHLWGVSYYDAIYCASALEVTYDLAAAKALRDWLDAAIAEMEQNNATD